LGTEVRKPESMWLPSQVPLRPRGLWR
jgi:hypothetical protein